MLKSTEKTILVLVVMLFLAVGLVSADAPVPPDRAQTALDLITLECQNLYDYSILASQGNTDNYEQVRSRLYTTANNVNLYIGSFDSDTVNSMNTLYQNFMPDADSAQSSYQTCQLVRENLYRKMMSTDGLLNPPQGIASFSDCASAGYYVLDGVCFIGGDTVFDDTGNIIGIYNATCFTGSDQYKNECWYCEYGSNNDGCLPLH